MERDDQKMGWIRVLLLIFPYVIIVGIFQIIGYIIAGNCYKLLVDITSYTTIQYIIIGINIVLFFLFFILKKHMAFKNTHNKDESLPQFMKSPQLILRNLLLTS